MLLYNSYNYIKALIVLVFLFFKCPLLVKQVQRRRLERDLSKLQKIVLLKQLTSKKYDYRKIIQEGDKQ